MSSEHGTLQNGDLNVTNTNELFYEALIFLQTLTPSTGISKRPWSEWHEFLDSLSWLCDDKRGGKTVTSIAISKTACDPLIWMTCNDRYNDERIVHLENIFKALGRLDTNSPLSCESIAASIAIDSIRRSYRRVLNYVKRLGNRLKGLESTSTDDDDIEELCTYIRSLLQTDDHNQMCLAFYQFRFLQQSQHLAIRCGSQIGISQEAWQAVQHLVGRLGSWHKSTKAVLALAMKDRRLTQSPPVRVVDHLEPMRFDFKPANFTLTSAVENTFALNNDHALSSVRSLFGEQELDLDQTFKKRKERRFQPRVHAEAAMADHFFRYDLEFWGEDQYIGCSKPSCFCCDLYLKNHGRPFSDRPCHGNIWINWCPTSPSAAESMLRDVPTETIMETMIQKMRDEAERLLFSGLRQSRTRPESTTGFSGSTSRAEHADSNGDAILQIWRPII